MNHTYTHTVLLHKDTYYTPHGRAHCCLGARPASSLNGHMQLFHGWTSLSLSQATRVTRSDGGKSLLSMNDEDYN